MKNFYRLSVMLATFITLPARSDPIDSNSPKLTIMARDPKGDLGNDVTVVQDATNIKVRGDHLITAVVPINSQYTNTLSLLGNTKTINGKIGVDYQWDRSLTVTIPGNSYPLTINKHSGGDWTPTNETPLTIPDFGLKGVKLRFVTPDDRFTMIAGNVLNCNLSYQLPDGQNISYTVSRQKPKPFESVLLAPEKTDTRVKIVCQNSGGKSSTFLVQYKSTDGELVLDSNTKREEPSATTMPSSGGH